MHWKDASVDRIICYCAKVSKKNIILAIVAGARSIEDIREKTGACCGGACSSTGEGHTVCCKEDIREMLNFYVGIVEQLRRRAV